MTRRRPLITYHNADYWALVARVLASGERFTIPCTRAQAASLRGELYAWRVACEKAPAEARDLGIDPDRLREVAWTIDGTGLITLPVGELVGPSLIRAALRSDPDTPASKAAEALANLKGMLNDQGEST
jgi:hypothetical protein